MINMPRVTKSIGDKAATSFSVRRRSWPFCVFSSAMVAVVVGEGWLGVFFPGYLVVEMELSDSVIPRRKALSPEYLIGRIRGWKELELTPTWPVSVWRFLHVR